MRAEWLRQFRAATASGRSNAISQGVRAAGRTPLAPKTGAGGYAVADAEANCRSTYGRMPPLR